MRWWAAAVLGGLLTFVPGGVDAAPSTCSARNSATIVENGVARVYRGDDDNILTCSKTNGRRRVIGYDVYDFIDDLQLRGHFVAFARESCEADGFDCAAGAYVIDVRRKEELFFSRGDIARVVLRANGSIAWGEHDLDPRYEDEREELGVIYRHTPRGTTRLDRDHLVDPESLRLTGRKLSWRHGAELRRATLR